MFRSSGVILAEKPSIGIEPTRLYDASRWKNHGVHTNITMVRRPSGLWVRQFNGSTSYIDVAGVTSASQSCTFEVWISSSATGTTEFIVDSETGRLLFAFLTDTANKIGYFDGAAWHSLADTPNDGYFHHLVLTLEKTNTTAIYFKDGIISGSDATYTPRNLGGLLNIGRGVTASDYLDGLIGLVRIYNYALSAGQVKKRFEARRHWFGV